ncbi:hypothetical protein V3C99_008917 [Haemonchus contortus]
MKIWFLTLSLVLLSQRVFCTIEGIIRSGFPELHVTYDGSHKASFGNDISPSTASSKPSLSWNAEPEALYTVIMVDLDAPSKKDPSLSEFLHWLVVNIHGQSINSGHELASYRGPRPPVGSGPHRYYFLVFKQKNPIPKKDVESRPRFDALAFARQNGMGDPIAGNFFKAQND